MKVQYRVSIELRYYVTNEYNEEEKEYINPTYTLGVTDTKEDAFNIGNKALDFLDKMYEKNMHCYYRLSNKMDIVSSSQYYKIPFEFYITIKPMNFNNIDTILTDTLKALLK